MKLLNGLQGTLCSRIDAILKAFPLRTEIEESTNNGRRIAQIFGDGSLKQHKINKQLNRNKMECLLGPKVGKPSSAIAYSGISVTKPA